MNILKFFEETVQRFPQKTAIAYKEISYSFSELSHQAKCLAERILQAGQTGKPVGVFVNRGADTAVLFLAVLYSGNYYIPIDPDMPSAKISSILTDAEPSVILCGEENKPVLEEIHYSGTIYTLDDRSSEECPVCESIDVDSPAYMVYTSGSTGKPKGVLKSHGAVISFIMAYSSYFHLGSDEIIGNQTPFFFDASAKDLYLMMYTGAALEVLPSEMFIFPVTLIEYMNERKVSYVCWVPTALAIVTQMNTFKKVLPETLKKVFFVGEVFPTKQLHKWLTTLPDIQYVNLYGSSELAGICCYYEIPDADHQPDILPIGKPLPNCKVLLLRDGVFINPKESIPSEGEDAGIGEICVIGDSLALEYFHDPEKTAKTFTALTLPDGTKVRALMTGDLARYDAEGNLVFVSRKDFQIKHMGRRIELGEIESVADTLPEIQRCCCLYNEKRKLIHLFCELIPGCDWDGRAVQHAMRGKISDYMLPTRITVLDAMPFNANGKIDRNKLKTML